MSEKQNRALRFAKFAARMILLLSTPLMLSSLLAAQSAPPIDAVATPPKNAKHPMAGTGVMSGEVTHHSALVQMRLTETAMSVNQDVAGAWGFVEFKAQPKGRRSVPLVKTAYCLPQRDFIARVHFSKLLGNVHDMCRRNMRS